MVLAQLDILLGKTHKKRTSTFTSYTKPKIGHRHNKYKGCSYKLSGGKKGENLYFLDVGKYFSGHKSHES